MDLDRPGVVHGLMRRRAERFEAVELNKGGMRRLEHGVTVVWGTAVSIPLFSLRGLRGSIVGVDA
jgi:hypothetical protein